MIWKTIKQQARKHGSKAALICHDKTYTYNELVESVEKLSATLSTAVKPGERLLFASEKEYHYVRMVLACDILGVTFLPTMPNLTDGMIERITKAGKPDHIILNEEDALKLEPHKEGLIFSKTQDDMYTIIFTSGTTGDPKAVPHTRSACIKGTLQNVEIQTLTSDDVILSQLPPWTIGGMYLYTLPGLMAGSTVIAEMFNPRKFIKICNEMKPTIGIMVPAMMLALSRHAAGKNLICHIGENLDLVVPFVQKKCYKNYSIKAHQQ